MKAALAQWDGKDTQFLKTLYAREFDFGDALQLCADQDVSSAASWLIKYHLERAIASSAQVQELLNAQRTQGPWDTLLHLVQALDRVDMQGGDVRHAVRDLSVLKDHDAPFVRAWSLSALARIANVHGAYKSQAIDFISAAVQREDKPSVHARLRKAAQLLDQS